MPKPVQSPDEAAILAVIEAHLSTGLGCRCGDWRIDTSQRPLDPRAQHRAHVAHVLAARAGGQQTQAEAALDEVRAEVKAALSRVDQSWGGAAMVVRDTVLSILGRGCTNEFCEHDHAAMRDLRAALPERAPTQAEQAVWPCDDYKQPLTCYTVPNGPKHLTCGGCRDAFPDGPDVQPLYRQREAEQAVERVRALAESYRARDIGVPAFTGTRIAAELTAALDGPDTEEQR